MAASARLVVTLEDGRDISIHLQQFSLSISHNLKPMEMSPHYIPAKRQLAITSEDFAFGTITVTPEELAGAFGLTRE